MNKIVKDQVSKEFDEQLKMGDSEGEDSDKEIKNVEATQQYFIDASR